jgi:threonylcarbamoyladenosine tRNA methylthiotransferase MtaB
MKKPTIAFYTLGCRVNQYETRKWMDQLWGGMEIVPFGHKADVTIINSCLVTTNAERDTRQILHRARKFSPNGKIIATGCYVDIKNEDTLLVEKDLIIVTRESKDKIPQIVASLLKKEITSCEGSLPSWAPSSSRPPLLIQTGCDKRCSYCIIPIARGPSVSRQTSDILSEYEIMVSKGFTEIVLTGINLGSWGRKFSPPKEFASLLEKLLGITPKGTRIRMGSFEPEYVTSELIDLMEHEALAPHIHLPMQGTSDSVLKSMGRPNTLSSYVKLVESLINKIGDMAVGADIISGYPTETEEDHIHGLELVKNLPLAYLHVFPYSSRPGTRAALLKPLPKQIVKIRSAQLREAGALLKSRFTCGFLNKTVEVSVERQNKSGKLSGMAGEFFQVEFDGNFKVDKTKLIPVKITDCKSPVVKGEKVG